MVSDKGFTKEGKKCMAEQLWSTKGGEVILQKIFIEIDPEGRLSQKLTPHPRLGAPGQETLQRSARDPAAREAVGETMNSDNRHRGNHLGVERKHTAAAEVFRRLPVNDKQNLHISSLSRPQGVIAKRRPRKKKEPTRRDLYDRRAAVRERNGGGTLSSPRHRKKGACTKGAVRPKETLFSKPRPWGGSRQIKNVKKRKRGQKEAGRKKTGRLCT